MISVSPRVLLTDFRQPDISGEIPFLFKKAGCTVEVFCAKNSWLRKNRFFDVWHEADVSSGEAYARGLAALVQSTAYDWVVLTEDEAIEAANRYIQDETIAARILPLVSLRHRALLASKAELSRLCMQYGITTPTFSIGDELTFPVTVPFPLLVKVSRSSGGAGVFLCENELELVETFNRLSQAERKDLVLQEYIAGANLSVEALFKEGTLLMCACSKIQETMGTEFAVSSVRTYYQDVPLEEQMMEVGQALGIDGFCTLTFMEDAKTGVRYLVEADTRPNIWFALLGNIGIDFSVGIRQYLGLPCGVPAPAVLPRTARQFYREINHSLEQKDFRNILRWVCNREDRWMFIPWYDQKIFRATLSLLIRVRVRRYTASHSWPRTLKRTCAKLWKSKR